MSVVTANIPDELNKALIADITWRSDDYAEMLDLLLTKQYEQINSKFLYSFGFIFFFHLFLPSKNVFQYYDGT